MVRLFSGVGDRARADELARPVLDGTLECHDVPRNVQLLYLQQALDYKDLAKAAPLAEALYRKSKLGDPSDLGYFGAVLRYFAFTAPRKAKKILKAFSFILGAALGPGQMVFISYWCMDCMP